MMVQLFVHAFLVENWCITEDSVNVKLKLS